MYLNHRDKMYEPSTGCIINSTISTLDFVCSFRSLDGLPLNPVFFSYCYKISF